MNILHNSALSQSNDVTPRLRRKFIETSLDLGVFFVVALTSSVCFAQNAYIQRNLVSDIPGLASITDTNLVNPWGIAASATSPFWVSDNHSGLSTLYNSTGAVQKVVVTVPAAAGGTGPGSPTGIIFNSTTDFVVTSSTSNAPAKFIFATEDGTISGWASGTNAVLKAHNSSAKAVYKGLASGTAGSSNYLYAANFYAGTIDVFDGNFAPATLAGSFSDPSVPAGFTPFNVQNLGGKLYVTYAKQDDDKEDDVGGPGNGFVNIFDTNGNLQKRLISNGVLNSPWGLAIAPSGFGLFAGELLVGNFGDGQINAFDPETGLYIGSIKDPAGKPISIQGLWGLKFGNGGNTNTLYFTAGIAGAGSVEDHGLFGSIAVAGPLQFTSAAIQGVALNLSWSTGVPPYLLQRKTSLADDTWMNMLTTTNQTAIVPTDSADAFYRLQDHATVTVTPFTVWLTGPGEAPKPTTSTATAYGLFSLEGSNLNYSVTYKGLSGPPTGAHIHGPAPSTNSAPVLQPLNPLGTETSGVLSGSMTLTAPQLDALLNNKVYANIHTAANPSGEIRGQLIPINLKANLNGTNETSNAATSATGLGTFTVVGNQLYYNVTYSGLSANAVAAHIHGPALPGVAANVLEPLPGVSGTSGVLSGSLTLTQPELGYLVDGLIYVNIHTSTNPNGEIRGQITP
jgi:uncharacterized protein (TIGR03118 family)